MADIPHNVQTSGIPSVRSVEMTAAEHQYHICVFFAAPVLPGVYHCVHAKSVQIALQSHCICVISPAYLYRPFRCRTLDHPQRPACSFCVKLDITRRPVIPASELLLNKGLQLFDRFCLGKRCFLKFSDHLALTFIFFFHIAKLLIQVSPRHRNNPSQLVLNGSPNPHNATPLTLYRSHYTQSGSLVQCFSPFRPAPPYQQQKVRLQVHRKAVPVR